MRFSMTIPCFSALLLTFLLTSSCGGREEVFPRAPVILISLDTLRSDRLPVYGYSAVETPALDALARDGILFERAYAHYPLTLPSHSNIMTGLTTPANGVRNNAGFVLEDRFETLAEVLKANGYRTGGIISSMVLKQSTGIAQGFDFFDDDMSTKAENRIRMFAQRRGDLSTDAAIQWLESRGAEPFFLFLHLYDPHAPYEAPEPFASRYPSAYDGEIAYTDSVLAHFFDFLKREGLYDPALILVLSDHGEGLGEHGEDEHGVLVYRESIQVPLLVKLPGGSRAGTRVAEPVGLIDIKPSILDSLGLEGDPGEGIPIFGSRKIPGDRMLFAETLYPFLQFGWCGSKSVIRENLHYIEICGPELYDLESDPAELENLFGKRSVPGAMVGLLAEIGEGVQTTQETSAEDLELLASLGYTGGVVGVDPADALDPKTQMVVFKQLDQAKALLAEKKFAETEAFIVPMLEQNPSLNDGRYLLIQALVEQGKLDQAEYVCLEGLGRYPDHLNYLISLTTIKLGLGKTEEALGSARKAMELGLDVAGAQLLLPLFDGGHTELAVSYAQQILQKFTDSALSAPYANLVLGRQARQANQHGNAIPYLEKCIALEDKVRTSKTLTLAYHALGDSLARTGNANRGLEMMKKAVALEPGYGEAHVALSYLYASMKNPARAVGALDEWLRDFPTKANFERAAKVALRLGLKTRAGVYQREAAKLE